MASNSDGVNPLRPYYIPPSIGEVADQPGAAASAATARHPPPHSLPHSNGTSPYSHKARDIFADLDYKDYIAEPSSSAVQSAKEIVDELLWRYTSVLMAQPFEVAKTILQVRSQDSQAGVVASAAAMSTPVAAHGPEPEPEPEIIGRRQRPFGYGNSSNDPVRLFTC